MTRAQILAELAGVEATINNAYWTFTRTARGRPCCLVVPEAYARRKELWAMLRASYARGRAMRAKRKA